MTTHYLSCPKCHHQPLPQDQSLPAACPACGLILAKYRGDTAALLAQRQANRAAQGGIFERLAATLLVVPDADTGLPLSARVLIFLGMTVWGLQLVMLDVSWGEINGSFIHTIMLPFHEAGHLFFRLLGEFMMFFGGTLGQLIMPVVLIVALLRENGDTFGASLGLWLLGASLLDIAPYMYDALHPQLILLSGGIGAEGGHDWIYLFNSLGLIQHSQGIGRATRYLGIFTMLVAGVWGGYLLHLQYRQNQQ